MEFHDLIDATAVEAAYRAKQFDFGEFPFSKLQVEGIQEDFPDHKQNRLAFGFTIQSRFNFNADWPGEDGNGNPWLDRRVAMAFHMAIDRFLIGDTVYLGDYQQSALPATPWFNTAWTIPEEELLTFPGYRPDRDLDITELRLLLDAAGIEPGTDFLLLPPDPWEGTYPGIVEVSKAMYENATEMTMNIDIQPYTVIIQRLTEGTYPGDIPSWDNPPQDLDPTNGWAQTNVPGASGNWFTYDHPPVTALVEKMQVTLDVEERKAMAREVQLMMLGVSTENPGLDGITGSVGAVNGIQRTIAWPYVNAGEDVFQFAHAVHRHDDTWHSNGLYYDFRPTVHIPRDEVLPLDDHYGFNPSMTAFKQLWDDRQLAVINGVGYPKPDRSHFRSMDIWHTAEPASIAQEGWLGRVIRELDPSGDNALTGVHFGRGLPRALGCRGVPVASVGNLDTYGLFPEVQDEWLRRVALETFSKMYGGADGRDVVKDYLGQTGSDALKGADILRTAPAQYQSTVDYPDSPLSQNLRSIAQVMFADLGTRVYYTTLGGWDTHSGELPTHASLWWDVSDGVGAFMADLRDHGYEQDTLVLVFSEFGRRIRDNGTGCDHGSGGVAFLIGGAVKGGMYGEYPSLKAEDQLDGDLQFNNDFRSTYSTVLDQWLGMDPGPIVNGHFEQFACL